jgi:hypothetical protein
MAAEQAAQGGGVAIEISRDFAERRDALFDGDGRKVSAEGGEAAGSRSTA